MPFILDEIRTGNPDADITILIARGCHRGTTHEKLVNIGTLPSGGRKRGYLCSSGRAGKAKEILGKKTLRFLPFLTVFLLWLQNKKKTDALVAN